MLIFSDEDKKRLKYLEGKRGELIGRIRRK